MQVPATSPRSISAPRRPAFTKSDDSGLPACPDPRINTSYWSAIASSLSPHDPWHLEGVHGKEDKQNRRRNLEQCNRQALHTAASDAATQPITRIRCDNGRHSADCGWKDPCH